MRAIILRQDRLLLVNAYPGRRSDLWCAPGGGVERGAGLKDNLEREVWEELGLRIAVNEPRLVNEFHEPRSGFHQVEVFFACDLLGSEEPLDWGDRAGVVNRRIWAARDEMSKLRFKPDALADAAWSAGPALYDPLEVIVA